MNLALVVHDIHKMSDQWKRCRPLGINSSQHLVRSDPAKIHSKQNDRGNQNRLPVLKKRLYRVKKRHPVSLNYFALLRLQSRAAKLYWPKLQRPAKTKCQVSLFGELLRGAVTLLCNVALFRVYIASSIDHPYTRGLGEVWRMDNPRQLPVSMDNRRQSLLLSMLCLKFLGFPIMLLLFSPPAPPLQERTFHEVEAFGGNPHVKQRCEIFTDAGFVEGMSEKSRPFWNCRVP